MSARDDYPALMAYSNYQSKSGGHLQAITALDEIDLLRTEADGALASILAMGTEIDRLRAEVESLRLQPGQHVVEVRRAVQGEMFVDPSSFCDPPFREQTSRIPYGKRAVVVKSAVPS